MNRSFFYTVLLLIFGQGVFAQPVNDQLRSIQPSKLSGHIYERLDDIYKHHILLREIAGLVAPFKLRTEKTRWQTEFWGKWLTSAVLAYRYQPDAGLKNKLDDAVKQLIATQSADGYIGNYAPDSRLQQWDIWGRKYCMLGLLDYYALTGDQNSLHSARKLADNLIADLAGADGIIVTKGNYRGMAASSVLEPICLLYRYTKKQKYLNFAEQIVRQWESPQGPQLISKAGVDVSKRFIKPAKDWYSWEQGQKAYEMMSCYEGLLELYRLTGKPEYKAAVEKTWQNIKDTEMNVAGSGASAEMWFSGKTWQTGPVHHYQETCVTVTWIKLSQQLLRLTGAAKYADAVEQAYYNALLGAISGDGLHWAKYTPLLGQRKPGSGQCGMDMNCCEASGPRGLFNLPAHIVMNSEKGIQVNYYIPGVYEGAGPKGAPISLIQETNYPETGTIRLSLKTVKPESFVLSFRIPEWSKATTVKVNGRPITPVVTGLMEIDRIWASGDVVELVLDMRGRVNWSGEGNAFAAIYRGPVLLARDTRFAGLDLSTTLKPVTDSDGYIGLKPADQAAENVWLKYTALFMPEYYTEQPGPPVAVTLCDYSSAGNGSEHSSFKVWLPQVYDPRK